MSLVASRLVLITLMVVLAGCGGAVIDAQSTPATIPEDDIESRGYVHENTTEIPLTYRLGGFLPVVSAQTWAAVYTKDASESQPAVLIVHTSPNRKLANVSINPLSQLSRREVIGFFLERMKNFQALGGVTEVSDLREKGTLNLTVLGESTQMVTYTGTAEIENERVGIVTNLAAVEHEGDVVVALGIYPDELDERTNHAALIPAIEHETN